MNSITVEREKLIAALRDNKQLYQVELLQAQKEYLVHAKEVMEKKTAEALAGKSVSIHLQAPQDHSNEYDVAIEMLSFGIDQTFPITLTEYEKYIRNEWPAMKQLAGLRMSYNSSNTEF